MEPRSASGVKSAEDASLDARADAGTKAADDELWPMLMRFGFERVLRHFVHTVAQFDLSPPQAHLLLQLGYGRAMSQRELARQLGCDPSNLTGLSDRLE